MATDITVHLNDEPGELARLGRVLGDSGVNIDGFCAVARGGGRAEIHLLVHHASAAFECLEAEGIDVAAEQEVAIVDVDEDKPGVLGDLSRRLSAAGANINLAYLATSTRLVFGADDLAKAKRALEA